MLGWMDVGNKSATPLVVTCFFNAQMPQSYGLSSSHFLESVGSCQGWWHIFCFAGVLGKCGRGRVWNAAIHFLMWCIWRERNNWTFNRDASPDFAVKMFLRQSLFEWFMAFGVGFANSIVGFTDLLQNPL